MKNEKMKKNFLTSVAFALALGLVACGDDSSSSGPSGDENPAEVSSSSVIPSEVEGSSSSVVSSSSVESSSSVASSSSEKSSSSVASSSSVVSSSSAKSSSSVVSSSSEKSSSSVASSSSVKSSSSVASSSSAESSSSSVILSSSSEESSIKDGSKYDASANTLTDLRDNQVYKTVTIGTQTWMAENLNYAYKGVKYNYDGYTSDSTSWCGGGSSTTAGDCSIYGRLYTWSAVMDSAAQFNVNAGTKCGYGKTCTPNSPHRGICPEGWHVPTNEEYSTLYTYIGGSSTAGSLLKSTSGWNDYNSKSGNGTDKYGFSVLPAGYRDNDGNFGNEGTNAGLWSASERNSVSAWYQSFGYDGDGARQTYYSKSYGRSLRCLKD